MDKNSKITRISLRDIVIANKKDIYIQISFFLGMFVLMYFWYLPFIQIFPMVDDLRAVRSFSSTSLGQILSTASINYRPVLLLILYLIINTFGYKMIHYYILNIFLNTIIALLIFRKTSKILNNNYLGFVFSFLYIISNFGFYGIVQIEGIMELLCLLFLFIFLSAIYDIFYGEAEKAFKYFYIALLSYLLIIFTHERFIVLILPLILTSLYKYKQSTNKKFLLVSNLSILSLLLNIFIKKIVFQIPFFRGTGGQLMKPNISYIFLHIGYHIKYLFGIHNDDEYLNGIASQNVSGIINLIIFISILSILLIFFIYYFFYAIKKDKLSESRKSFYFTFLFIITIGLLFGSSSATIRVEQRWIYAPYMISLFLLCHILMINKKVSMELLKQNIEIQPKLSVFIEIILIWIPIAIILFYKLNNNEYFLPIILCFGLFITIVVIKRKYLFDLSSKYFKVEYFNRILNIVLLIYAISTFSYTLYYRNYFNNIFLMWWHDEGRQWPEKKYEIGKTIYLGTSYNEYTPENNKYIKSGLSVEDWFSWNGEEITELAIFFDDVQNDLLFQADIATIFGETQEIKLFINDNFVDSVTLMKNDLKSITFVIKKEYLFYGPNVFKFEFPQAVSPAELGLNEDIRKLSVAFKSFVIDYYDEKKYEIGKTIYLGTSYNDYTPENDKYIKSGLSIEDWYAWSNDEITELILFIENIKNDLLFQTDIVTILGEKQEVQFYVNNHFVDKITLINSNLGEIDFLIKKDYLLYGQNEFKFVFPQAISPAELGTGGDLRKLAVAFKSFEINLYDTPKIDDDIFN